MNHFLFMNVGGSELILIVLVVLLFFGAKGVPEIAKSLGKASREFKDAMSGLEREIRDVSNPDVPAAKKEEPLKTEEPVHKPGDGVQKHDV
ncbi:MAG: twin-arginine translocase TatA/TatE family subunit [Bacteroidetes bacterium]|nr:twin-arginine translocase TatA/TatE family subunit [Bacteroidota bacterium]